MNQQSVSLGGSKSTLRFVLNRLGERLWFRPLIACALSVASVFLAGVADDIDVFSGKLPAITYDSLQSLLSIMAASMLVIATFTVGSMLSAYASASDVATPRSLSLVIADDVSQNALSAFIGAFIFSIVGLVAHMNGVYKEAGTFVLFVFTLTVFALIILSFVRWVDRIARLGRLGETINKVEAVSTEVLKSYAHYPTLGARCLDGETQGDPVLSEQVGFIQQLDIRCLQEIAEQVGGHVYVCAQPGQFISLHEPLAFIQREGQSNESVHEAIAKAFRIGPCRTFDEDPRFGMIVLSEIASRALSPAVNDPGTAIDIIGTIVRIISTWSSTAKQADTDAHTSDTDSQPNYDRVFVRELSLEQLFGDAFNAIARDGAHLREVSVSLQKAFLSFRRLENTSVDEATRSRALYALRCAEKALTQEEDIEAVRELADQVLR